MKKDFSKSSETQDFGKQEEENNKSPLDEILKAILGLCLLPIVIAYLATPQFATTEKIWRIKEFTLKLVMFSLFLVPVNVLSFKYLLHFLSEKNWTLTFVCLVTSWISLTPISLLLVSYRLSEIQTDFANGLTPPNQLKGIRNALTSYGFKRASRLFVSNGYQFPSFSERGETLLGIKAQQPDFRFRKAKRENSDLNSLDKFVNGDYITFGVNAEEGAHHLIIGATGSGKSILMSRMALCALLKENRVIIFDFKGGDEKYMYEGLKEFVPNRKVKVMKFPSQAIDLFTGDPEEIADRLIGFLPSATQGDGDYYRSRMIRAINAVIVRTSHQPPKSVDEVLKRIRNGITFAEDPEDLAMFKQKEKGVPIGEMIAEGLASRFEPLRKSGGRATSGGFKWDDPWDMAVLSFRNTSEGDVRLGGAILNSLDGWLWSPERNLDPRPILLMVDEGGVLQNYAGTPSLLNMVARARSKRCGVVVASQTVESMGLEGKELLDTGPTRWLGRTPNPETMVIATGTKDVIETSFQQSPNGWEGKKTGRLQKAFVIDPDVIRGLPKFFWSIGDGNSSVFVFVPPIDFKN